MVALALRNSGQSNLRRFSVWRRRQQNTAIQVNHFPSDSPSSWLKGADSFQIGVRAKGAAELHLTLE